MGKDYNGALEKIKSTLGLRQVKDFDKKKAVTLIKKAKKEKISKEQLEALIKVAPEVAKITTSAFQSIADVSKSAGKEGEAAFDALKTCVKTLNHLSQREELSDQAIQTISHTTLEAARILSETNKENKRFWGKVVGGIVVVFCVLGFAKSSNS